MNETDEVDDSFSDRLIENLFATWIDDELEDRGGLTRSWVTSAVVELPPDNADAIIRLNEEVSLQAKMVVAADVSRGDLVTADNIENVESFSPVDVGPNSGWMVYAIIGDAAYMQFDFRYNKQRTNELLQLAQQYVQAVEAIQHRALRPAVDNLLSAAELTVQAQMLGQAQETRVHNVREKWLHEDERLGNATSGFSAVLKRLSKERSAARYGDGTLKISLKELIGLTAQVRSMIKHAAERVGVTVIDEDGLPNDLADAAS